MRALVVKPHRLSATGFVGERFRRRGVELIDHVASEVGAPPALDGFAAVIVMGAPWSVYGTEVEPWIDEVLELVREADRKGLSVLGVCFGAQSLAAAFGADVRRGETELGWNEVSTIDPSLIPAGPWFMWHSDTFDLPPGAQEVARTDTGPQAFALRRHLGVQFHPEADARVVHAWMRHDDSDFRNAGLSIDRVLVETRERQSEARLRAGRLVDGFLDGRAVPSGP